MGGCQCPVYLAVQLAQVFSAVLIVLLFEQNYMYVMYVLKVALKRRKLLSLSKRRTKQVTLKKFAFKNGSVRLESEICR